MWIFFESNILHVLDNDDPHINQGVHITASAKFFSLFKEPLTGIHKVLGLGPGIFLGIQFVSSRHHYHKPSLLSHTSQLYTYM